MPVLETSRLTLEPVQATDLGFFGFFLSSPVLTRYLPKGRPYSPQETAAYLEDRCRHWDRGFGTFVLRTREPAPEAVGYVGIETVGGGGCWDLRYGILAPHQGKGYAFEAAEACVEAFLARGLAPAVYGVCVSENLPSRRILERLGMVPDAGPPLYEGPGLVQFRKSGTSGP